MTWMTVKQFMAFDKKCSHCNKPAKWVASQNYPVYCDEHFPYTDIEKSMIHISEPNKFIGGGPCDNVNLKE